MFEVNKCRCYQCIKIIRFATDLAFQMHHLVIGNYILQVIPAYFNSPLWFLREEVPYIDNILWHGKGSVEKIVKVWFITSLRFLQCKIIIVSCVVFEVNRTAGILIAVITPCNVEIAKLTLSVDTNSSRYGYENAN